MPVGLSLRVALLNTGRSARARHDGAVLGVEEAQHAAALFGGTVSLSLIPRPDEVGAAGVAAVLGDDDEANCRAIITRGGVAGPLLMNVACASDALRGAWCSTRAFHVCPSEAMFRDARSSARAVDAVAWDSSLSRFGADTLNERFRRRFGAGMTSDSWAAWFAVKVLWESSLRMKSVDPARIADYLTRDTTRFDGHKGQPLSFRSWDHQLRQPLYARTATGFAELPATRAPGESANDALDRLGELAKASPCRMGA